MSHKDLLFPRYNLRTKLEFEDIIMKKYKLNYKQLKKTLKKPYIGFELKNLYKLLNTEEKQFKSQEELTNFLENWNYLLVLNLNQQELYSLLNNNDETVKQKIKILYTLVKENKDKLTLMELYTLLKENNTIKEFTGLFDTIIKWLQMYESYSKYKEQKLYNTILLNQDLLLYMRSSAWKTLKMQQNQIVYGDDEYNKFIYNIKQCYNRNYITPSKYKSLLKWLLYINVYDAFNAIREGLLVYSKNIKNYKILTIDSIDNILMNKTERNIPVLLKHLLCENKHYNRIGNISEFWREKFDDDKYLKNTVIINQILNDLISLIFENSSQEISNKKVKSKILSIIIQGIYDNAYCKNGKKYEEPSIEYREAFKKQVAIDKIDQEFSVTKKIESHFKKTKQL